MDHKWRKDRDGAESCEREGCTVRKTDEFWQPKKREWHGCTNQGGHSFSEGVCEEDGCGMDLRTPSERAEQQRNDQPVPSPLEVVRARFHDFIKRKTPSTNEESYWRSALATLEESIRSDELAMAITQAEDEANNHPLVSTSMRLRVRLSKLRGHVRRCE